ncbi:nSTAND1 domain-containing NTPase [Streptomyces adonidis]|uniref:nSTAND1 domain-containing NTPase n=1 Tax=Streptomyces adonidis TaxID=3231367 RepID=UPI0034DB153D
MGRPERPVDPEAGPVQRLAHELRELRRTAGGPSYRTMAEAAGFSATTLSDAAAGKRLPSLPVVQGYVRACGGDPGEWETRWKDADAEAAGALRAETEDAAPPYRGLARFEPDDRALFFGRDRLVAELKELVCSHRFAVVFGASGSGKSSLLRAGLIPRLREEIADLGCPAVLRVLTPGVRPAQTYGHLLTSAEGEPESWVVVDQFEEVFTLCRDRAERNRFIDLLLAARAPESRLRVLIAVRADFYPRCAEHRDLADALYGAGLLVGPMTADELREAVVGPAQAAGLLVERELTARIVDEVLDQPGALPMLSHALLETWRRRRSRLLTLSAYEATGGVSGAIAATAEQVYGHLSPPQARTARRLLLGLIEPGRGTADTRRPLTRAELAERSDPDVPAVVEQLARNRLVTVDEDCVQLAHEALMTRWPRLRGWIEEDRDRIRHHRRLTEAAQAWLEHDRDPGALYRGARLSRAEELFAAEGADESGGVEGAEGPGGVEGAGEAGGAERTGGTEGAEGAKGAGGRGRPVRRWGWRVRGSAPSGARGTARPAPTGPQWTTELTAPAGGRGGSVRRWGWRVRGSAPSGARGTARPASTGPQWITELTAAAGGRGGSVRRWGWRVRGSAPSGARGTARPASTGPQWTTELTALERNFLTAALDAREAEHRAETRTTRRSRALVSAFAAILAVSLVIGLAAWHQSRDNERHRTDTAARRVAEVADAMRTTDPHTAMLLGVAAWRVSPLPEARRALLGSLAQAEHAIFTDPAPGNGPARFLADSGRTLLSVDGRTWRTWNVLKSRRTASGRLPAGQVLAAGPDARVLAIAGDDGIRLWDTATGRWTGDPRPLPFTSDADITTGGYLVSDIDDDRVRLRSLTDGSVLYEGRAAGLVTPAVSTDGRLVAVCPADGSPQVWDTVRHRVRPGPWERAKGLCGEEEQTALVFGGADGDRLAALSKSGAKVWDTESAREVADIAEPGAERAAFTKDGTFLATADGEEIRVWRLSDPAAPVFRHPLNNQHLYGLSWDPAHPNILRYLEGGAVHCLELGPAVTRSWREHPLTAVRMSPDARTYATAELVGDRYRFELRATSDGHLLHTLPAPPRPVSADPADPVIPEHMVALLAFSPDGKALSYGVSAPGRNAAPQRFTVWDTTHARPRATLDLATGESAAPVVALALGPAGDTLYATRLPVLGEPTNEAWTTGTGPRSTVIPGLTSTHLAVRPDGHLLVGDNRTLRMPATKTGGEVTGNVTAKVTGAELVQGEQIGALAFAADGSRLAAGDQTGRVALWDGELGHRTGILRNVFPAPLGEEPESVSALAVSPDGATLAVGGSTGTLQLWDIATQQPLGGPLTTPGEQIDSLTFGADSGTLYAGSAHVPLQRYVVDADRAATRVCARAGAGADLSREQWETYVPEVAYRKVCVS